jgi:hypothetical protein
MKFKLTKDELNGVAQCIDTYLKHTGLAGLETAHILVSKFNQPIQSEEGNDQEAIFELNEDDVKVLIGGIFDISIKVIGLSGAQGILKLVEIFTKPIEDNLEEEIVDDDEFKE